MLRRVTMTSFALAAVMAGCGGGGPGVDAGAAGGGSSAGAAGGTAGGSSGGTAGGVAGGTAGGSSGGTAGGVAGGTAGGSAGGTAGGSAGGTAGGDAGGAAGGSAGGTAGGSAGGTAGGVAGGTAGGGAGGTAGGSAGGTAGGSAGGTAGGVAGGTAGGVAGGTAGGSAGGTAGGVAGGTAGGSAGGTAGGSAGGTAGGSAGGTAGGSAGGTAGGVAGGTAGGSAGGTAGGSAGGTAGGSAGGAVDAGGPFCGDGIINGSEQCDDGNASNVDGCLTSCLRPTGESCASPFALVQGASLDGGAFRFTLDAGAVTAVNGRFACDPNGIGPDAVIQYVKTTPDLDGGGRLLHVQVLPPPTVPTSQYVDVEVIAGSCDAADAGASLKCLWYKRNWDVYLDLPAGPVQVWVAKNSAATSTVGFPHTDVFIEEVPAQAAEGEGCFAPYTSASAVYTPPSTPGGPATFTLPSTINSFDMGATWGAPGSISCDDTAPYGDIHGVDSVIRYDKASATSVLRVDVQNLDPTLSQSDLNVELLNVCNPTAMSKQSFTCRANADTHSITARPPAGPVYIWVSTEATSEEFNGARVEVTEVTPGPGESWPTAQPLAAMSGPIPIAPTSMQRLDAPSCFPAGVNVHWYAYTLVNNAVGVSATGAAHLALYDENGLQRACVADGQASPLGFVGVPGDVVYVAVTSPTTITALTLVDVLYTGVTGRIIDLDVQFPASPLTEFGMAVAQGSDVYLGGTSALFKFSGVVVSGAATQPQADAGIGTTQLGYDLVAVGAQVFSVDSTTTTTASRLFRVFDGTDWRVTPWDLTPTYPTSAPTHAITADGTTLFLSTRRTTASSGVEFYAVSAAAPGTPMLVGTNPVLWYATGLAVDSTYFYVASNGPQGEGVYRVSRANIAGTPVRLAAIDTGTLTNNLEVDSATVPQNLYVRAANGDVHAVVNPASGTPVHIGAITTIGDGSDYGMAYDRTRRVLYLFETDTDTAGRVVQVD
ncbi:MAG: myxococcus cysteine-rich repeat containing protein [Myxococcaceae bacterium]|nr:myxococcus cysteine-rich repeat containing protein [Myxococcaceae bacterium]